jgi:hypothetical protein
MAAPANNRTPFFFIPLTLPHLPPTTSYTSTLSCLIFHPFCDLASSISSFFILTIGHPDACFLKFIATIIYFSPHCPGFDTFAWLIF